MFVLLRFDWFDLLIACCAWLSDCFLLLFLLPSLPVLLKPSVAEAWSHTSHFSAIVQANLLVHVADYRFVASNYCYGKQH